MAKPLLYDGYCGGGGAAKGYMEVGFRVVGIDVKPQPHYCGDSFIQMDFFEFFARVQAGEYPEPAAWHCSPPCQGYSIMNNLPWLNGREYPLLILPTLELLEASGKPYVLENVMGARHGAKGLQKRGLEAHGLKAGWLCGTMFGLPFYRHRLFATNWFWLAPGHPRHTFVIRPGKGYGDSGDKANGRMDGLFPWMTKREARQAIPSVYTRFMGARLLKIVLAPGVRPGVENKKEVGSED